MRRRTKWIAWTLAALVALTGVLLALVIFGGRDPDWNGTVLLRWDAQRKALEFLVPPRPGLDGPYVFRDAEGYSVARMQPSDGRWTLHRERLPADAGTSVIVHVDNPAKTRFNVVLRPLAQPLSADLPGNPPRLLMLSDIEGQFDRFTALLQSQGVVDETLHWAFGTGHVALAGDFVDRGDDVIPLLWLIYRLEDEAVRAGGRLHYVLGNHELMGLNGNAGSWPPRMLASAQRIGRNGQSRVFSNEGVLGQWLRSKPVIARIGDHLVMHGGVSEDFLQTGLSVDEANALARPWLDRRRVFMPAAVQPVLGRAGVTRYRGLADAELQREADVVAHLRGVAQRFGVRRVAIGHTITPDIALEHSGLLLRLDVHHKTQVPQAALYEDGILWRVYADGRRTRLR